MIEQAIKAIADMAPAKGGRQSSLTIADPANQQVFHYLYNDEVGKYELEETIEVLPPRKGSVSNVESFLALVREETLRRAPEPENDKPAKPARHDGSFMTVTFRETGATFSPDDRVQVDGFQYERALSPQWAQLMAALKAPMDHKTFIRVLQALRPSISGYEDLMRHFRKLSFSDRTSIASEPLLEAGQNANEYKVEIELRSGAAAGPTTSATSLPSSFGVAVQYARGSEKKYTTTIEIDLAAVMIQNSDRKALRFSLIAPDLANVIEQAVDDEVAFFRKETADIPRLLILQDY